MEHSTDPLRDRMDALAARLERLSRQNLRYRRAMLVVAAGAGRDGTGPGEARSRRNPRAALRPAPGENRLGATLTVDRVVSRLSLSDGTGP